jgi:aminopeptidase N
MHRPFALPGTRPRYVRDRGYDMRHLRLDLALDFEARRLAGTATLRVAPLAGTPRRLELDAVELAIDTVEADGRELAFAYDGCVLAIEPPQGEEIELRIRYSATPRRGLYFVGPDAAYPHKPRQIWSQGQDEDSRHWFPCFDSPLAKCTTELCVTVPEGMICVSNGRLVEQYGRTFHYRLDVPHSPYLVTLVAGEYACVRARAGAVELMYFVPPGREEDAARALGRTPDMIGFFADYLGVPYPYERYSQVCVADFLFGGMENTSATTLTLDTLHDARAHLDFSSEPLVSHELAHQWFGDLVTCRDWSEAWLNEGFATYLEVLWQEHAHGADEMAFERADYMDQYMREDRERYRRRLVERRWDEPLEIFDRHLYEKGALVLHMIRRHVGDAGFRAALARYLMRHRGGTAETRDLARAIEEATGRNVDAFFDQWVYGAGHPELHARYEWDDERQAVRIELEQTQALADDTPLHALEFEVAAEVDGEWRTVALVAEPAAKQTLSVPLPARPTGFVIDAGRHVLASWRVDKPLLVWARELSAAPQAIDRAQAATALGRDASQLARQSLTRSLEHDTFWGVRAACARALGQVGGPVALAALLERLGREPHAKARRAIVRALGEFVADAEAQAALEQCFRQGDASYFVEAEAVHALCRTGADAALEVAQLALGRPSHGEIIRQLACTGLGELRAPDERRDAALSLLREETAYGRPVQSRRAAATALGALGEGRAPVREHLERLTTDPDFRMRLAVVLALGALGDARAVAAIERAEARELDGRVRRRCREVTRSLREGVRREETVQRLTEEVAELKRDGRKLVERIERLEGQLGKASQ